VCEDYRLLLENELCAEKKLAPKIDSENLGTENRGKMEVRSIVCLSHGCWVSGNGILERLYGASENE
jgi:hypothetical protein